MMRIVMIQCKLTNTSEHRKFIESLPEYELNAVPAYKQLGKKTRRSQNLTLVLDLDETLINSSTEPENGYDFKINLAEQNEAPQDVFSWSKLKK